MILGYYFFAHCRLLFLSVAWYTQLCACSRPPRGHALVWAPTHFTDLTWISTPQPWNAIALLRSLNKTWIYLFFMKSRDLDLLCQTTLLSFHFPDNKTWLSFVCSSTKRLRFVAKWPRWSSLTTPSPAPSDMVRLSLAIALFQPDRLSSCHTFTVCIKLISQRTSLSHALLMTEGLWPSVSAFCLKWI